MTLRLRFLTLGVGSALLAIILSGSVASAQFGAIFWPTEGPPRPLDPREFKLPPYEIRTLPNGLQVVTVLHHEQPAVTMRLLVRAGAAQDPKGKSGLADLVAKLLDQGTTTRTAPQIADQIDSIGGAMGTGSGTDLSSVYAVVMKDSFGVAMELVHDVVRNPAFAPDEIDRQKEQAVSSLQVSAGDGDYIASALFDRLVYGFHPYGLPGNGTADSIASLTRQDLQSFHKQYFVPNNMILAIVGDVTSDEAFATAQRVFGSWPRGDVPAAAPVEPPPPTRRIIVVDKPDAVQTEIRLGQLAIPRKHNDYLAWDLTVKILGGEGANRLHRVLRSERGLTYGASADTQAMKQAGDFMAETDTRTETTGEALRLIVEEVARLQSRRVSERELADAQAYLSGSFPLTVETPNDIATLVLNQVFYDLPLDELQTFQKRVVSITPDDIQRTAKQYIRPDRLSIVLVGNAKAFLGQLKGLGFEDVEVIPIEQLDMMSATLRREPARRGAAALPAALPLTEADFVASRRTAYTATQVSPAARSGVGGSDAGARELLKRVVDMRGGLAALKGIKSITVETETTVHLQPESLPATTRTYVVYPDRFRIDTMVPNVGEVVQVYNAGKAWEKSPAGVREAPPPMLADMRASVRRDIIPLLIGASDGLLVVRQRPDQKMRSGRVVKALEISGIDIPAVRLFVDDEGMIAGQSFTSPGGNNRPLVTEELFSDYRLVQSVRVPFVAEYMQNGRRIFTRRITSITFNASLTDDLFERPQ